MNKTLIGLNHMDWNEEAKGEKNGVNRRTLVKNGS
jgi:hypothetical protein